MLASLLPKQKMPIRNIIVISLTILVLLNIRCTPLERQFGIIFSANLDGNQDIYHISTLDFQSVDRLTFTPIDQEEYLKVTKDGNQILFFLPRPDSERIRSESLTPPATYAHTYILDLKSKSTTELSHSLGLFPSIPQDWSIDESSFILSEGETNKIYMVNPDKKIKEELNFPTSKGTYAFGMNYSPDGAKILYSLTNIYAKPIQTSFFYDLETKEGVQLGYPSTPECSDPKWSPTGKQILLYCQSEFDIRPRSDHFYIFDVTNNDPFTIKETSDLACGLRFGFVNDAIFEWSPDGKQFVAAYCKIDNNPKSLIIFNSDGSIDKEFPPLGTSDAPIYITEMSWSPDGQKILYIAGKDKNSLNIYIMNVDGSDNHAITTQPSNYSELSVYSIEQ